MLQLQIIGNLTKDAEQKQINGNEYLSFTAACNNGGNSDAMFIRVLKKVSENNGLAQYLTKGRKVFVQGRMSVSVYASNGNEPNADVTCWAEKIELCGEPKQQPAI